MAARAVVQGIVHPSAKLQRPVTSLAPRMDSRHTPLNGKEQKSVDTASHRRTITRGTARWHRRAVAENEPPGGCSQDAQPEDGHWDYTAQAARQSRRCLS